MTDLAETIGRWRGRLERTKIMRVTAYEIDAADLTRLLDAAERALALDSVGFTPSTPDLERARDAALEEAARYMDECGLTIQAKAIRSLKGAA